MLSYSIYALLMLASGIFTKLLCICLNGNKLLDIPNQRSLHAEPTLKGGGVIFVVIFISAIVILSWQHKINVANFIPMLLPIAIIAVIGLLDDIFFYSAMQRILWHFIAASLVVYYLGGISGLGFNLNSPILIICCNIVLLVYLVWMLNLFNFMDGVDGLAAIETLTVCIGCAILYFIFGNRDAQAFHILYNIPLLLAAAVAGFLCINFPPAKIFMGDIGSGFLGLVLGILSLFAMQENLNFFYSWIIMLAVFITDATVTLLRRAWNQEKIFEPHRSHAYQHAALDYGNHLPVTLAVCL